MTSDGNRGATLTYNYLNLPKTVVINSKTLTYDYDAAGTKHRYATDTLTIKYAGPFEYNASNNFSRLAISEGQALFRKDTPRFDYYLKDHLGNVPIVFDEKGKILQQTDYYPFGLEISRDTPASTQAARNGANRYNFLGRETQVSTGYIDLQARFYDPAVGRFFRIDPMLEDAYDWTPYRYGFDNPIRYSDEDGLFETEEEARKYAKDNGIRTGWFGDNKIRQQADGSYAINNKSAGTSIFNDKDQGVTTAVLATGTRESSGSTSDASTMALPISLSLPSLAGIGEKVAEISLNGLKTTATIPLMTLAFVLTPTPAGEGSTVNPATVNYSTPPRTLPGFPGAARDKNKSGRARWKTPDGDILEWDYQHGRVERYDKRGNHKGEFDPNTGEQTKPREPGRKTQN